MLYFKINVKNFELSENKKIVKNTLFLYVRMFFTMGISLYTSRVILQVLGIQDYGIYIVVGGVVSLFGFLNGAMASATQRFLSFDIGNDNENQLKKTFNATLNIHFLIALIALILSETLGLWFINNKLNIIENRMFAVNFVYQFSVFTFLLGVIQVPYDALIIAREKMYIYAYMSIIEVILKLVILYLLTLFDYDYLILYAFFLFIVSFIIRMGHKYYCKIHFMETKYEFYYDKSYYKKLLSYSVWNLFGNIAAVVKGQGINVLLNLFFGTILNAAYGITLQLQGAVSLFVNNFQLAVSPQIIKTYAQGNTGRCHALILQSSKFSYYLMLLLISPFVLNIDFILEFWLKTPPDFTKTFVLLALLNLLVDCISGPLMAGLQATGKIKAYQSFVGILLILNLPLSYVFLKYLNVPEYVFYSSIAISIVALFLRLYFVKINLELSILSFFKIVILPILIISGIVFIIIYSINKNTIVTISWGQLVLKSTFIFVTTFILIMSIGMNKNEKFFIKNFILSKLKRS